MSDEQKKAPLTEEQKKLAKYGALLKGAADLGPRTKAAVLIELTHDGDVHVHASGSNLDIAGACGLVQQHSNALVMRGFVNHQQPAQPAPAPAEPEKAESPAAPQESTTQETPA